MGRQYQQLENAEAGKAEHDPVVMMQTILQFDRGRRPSGACAFA